MPAIVRRAKFLDEFKRHARAFLRVLHGVGAVVPRTLHGAGAERIAARAAKGVPVNHGEPEMFAQGFAFDDFLGIVMFEGQRVFRLGTFVGDAADVGER